MATSVIEICNNALIKIGSDTITSLLDNTKAARTCNKMYEIVRDDLLRSHPWNFAINRVKLAKLSAIPAFDYSAQYQLPSDCLRVIAVKDDTSDYRVEGRKILTNGSEVSLLYIKREEDVALYDTSFSNLLALKLASEIAYNMVNSTTLAKALNEKAEVDFRMAKRMDSQEDSLKMLITDTFLNSRLT